MTKLSHCDNVINDEIIRLSRYCCVSIVVFHCYTAITLSLIILSDYHIIVVFDDVLSGVYLRYNNAVRV
jgi:hypothetical protein